MKIRNNKTNIEISSPHICKGSYNGEDVFLDENFEELFYLRDGWEEVEEEVDSGNKWHDLRKDPTDVPNNNRWVWACFNFSGRKQYQQVCFAGQNDWWIAYSTKFAAADPDAWCELPKFEEE